MGFQCARARLARHGSIPAASFRNDRERELRLGKNSACREAWRVNPASSRSQLVFDISREWYRGWWFPAFGLVFVAGSLTFLLYARRPRTPPLAHGLLV